MKDVRTLTTLVALLGVALIGGCGQRQDDAKDGASRADTAVAQQEQGRGNDPMQSRDKGVTDDARRTAEELAGKAPASVGQTPGKPGDAIDDAAITAAVKSALAADPQLSALTIGVDTQAGVVTLTGRAPHSRVADRAMQVAATNKGVMRVENRLAVDGKS